MGEQIALQQVVHGYRDGHQLLVSSTQLNREQESQLLMMSDLSGPSFREGFDSYLTGYPLTVGGYYCIARTWFARELPRPGCVWTQSILISDTDVARIADFRWVLDVFRRPVSLRNLDHYAGSILLCPRPTEPYHLDVMVATRLLTSLYDSELGVVLVSDSADRYEGLVLAVLSQQWPRLRRKFRFCTGVLLLREKAEFDLAVVPSRTLRSEGESRTRTIVSAMDEEADVTIEKHDDWLQAATADLASGDHQSDLRQFLWRFGPDYQNGRSVFRALCEIHLAASRTTDTVEQALSAVAHYFPNHESSRRLKGEYFGPRGHYSWTNGGEASVLYALAAHPLRGSVGDDVALMESRSRELVSADWDRALEIAVNVYSVGGARANEFLNGFAAGISSQMPKDVPLGLLLELLQRRPELAESPDFWHRLPDEQVAIAVHLGQLGGKRPHFHRSTIDAMLDAGAWAAVPVVLAQLGREGVARVLEWVDTIDRPSVLPHLEAALKEHRSEVSEVVATGSLQVRSLRLVTLLLDPRSDTVRDLGIRPWIKVAEAHVSNDLTEEELRSRVFLLTLGLSLEEPEDVILVRNAYSNVYEAARANRIDENIWEYIEPYLPWYVREWAPGARLTRAVVKRFVVRSWPPPDFFATFVTEEQFERALEEIGRTRDGRRYIKKLRESANRSNAPVRMHQVLALQRHSLH